MEVGEAGVGDGDGGGEAGRKEARHTGGGGEGVLSVLVSCGCRGGQSG